MCPAVGATRCGVACGVWDAGITWLERDVEVGERAGTAVEGVGGAGLEALVIRLVAGMLVVGDDGVVVGVGDEGSVEEQPIAIGAVASSASTRHRAARLLRFALRWLLTRVVTLVSYMRFARGPLSRSANCFDMQFNFDSS